MTAFMYVSASVMLFIGRLFLSGTEHVTYQIKNEKKWKEDKEDGSKNFEGFLPSCFAKGALLHIENWQENQKLAFFNEKVLKLSTVHTDDLTK